MHTLWWHQGRLRPPEIQQREKCQVRNMTCEKIPSKEEATVVVDVEQSGLKIFFLHLAIKGSAVKLQTMSHIPLSRRYHL